MNRVWAFIFGLSILLAAGTAYAEYLDYTTAYPINNGCRPVWTNEYCGPINPAPQDKVNCIYSFATQICCCYGLVWIPDAPKNVQATAQDNTITINWDEDPTATHYELYWSKYPVIEMDSEHRIVLDNNFYIHESLDPNTTYYYSISARNSHTSYFLHKSSWTSATTGY